MTEFLKYFYRKNAYNFAKKFKMNELHVLILGFKYDWNKNEFNEDEITKNNLFM